MAFIFISSPLWTNITIKNKNIEINLYRQSVIKQADANIELIENLKKYIDDKKQIEVIDKLVIELKNAKTQFEKQINKKTLETLAKSTAEAIEITRPLPPTNLRIVQ